MPFKPGVIPWNKGKVGVYSKEVLEAWSEQRQGRPGYFKGKAHSKESIDKIKAGIAKHPNRKGPKGKPWSQLRRLAQEKRNGAPYKRSATGKRTPIKKGKNIYHERWHEIRLEIYTRDRGVCAVCDCKCTLKGKTKIQCHHIDYTTSNNRYKNLITLCASCHAKTNYNREKWTAYFSNERN